MTTVVVPVGLSGTQSGGAAGDLGSVERVPVEPLPAGESEPAYPPLGVSGMSESVEIALQRFGHGPNLLLIAGERCTMTCWDDTTLASLARSYRVTVFDPPGSGYSGPPLAPMTVSYEADVVAGLIAALGLRDTTVLGWGIGGEVALATAERHPASVARLVLLDATAGGHDGVPPPASVAAALASPRETLAELSRLYFPPSAGPARLQWLTQMSEPAPDDLVAPAVAGSAAFARQAWSSPSVAAGLAGIDVPTLVIVGADDEVVPPANGARLAGALGTTEYLLRGAGYAAMAQDTGTVLAILQRFTSGSSAGVPVLPTGAPPAASTSTSTPAASTLAPATTIDSVSTAPTTPPRSGS